MSERDVNWERQARSYQWIESTWKAERQPRRECERKIKRSYSLKLHLFLGFGLNEWMICELYIRITNESHDKKHRVHWWFVYFAPQSDYFSQMNFLRLKCYNANLFAEIQRDGRSKHVANDQPNYMGKMPTIFLLICRSERDNWSWTLAALKIIWVEATWTRRLVDAMEFNFREILSAPNHVSIAYECVLNVWLCRISNAWQSQSHINHMLNAMVIHEWPQAKFAFLSISFSMFKQ